MSVTFAQITTITILILMVKHRLIDNIIIIYEVPIITQYIDIEILPLYMYGTLCHSTLNIFSAL